MKTKLLSVILLTAFVFTSCSTDNEENEKWNGQIRLSSGSVEEVRVKSITQDLQSTQFDSGESIGVFINENTIGGVIPITTYDQPLIYTATGSGGMTISEAKQPYYPQSGNGVNIFAFYPSTAVEALDTPKSFSVQTDQSEDIAYKASDLMYGIPDGNPVERTRNTVKLTFEHLLSKINVKLVNGDGNPNIVGATVKLKKIKTSTIFDPQNGIITEASGDASDITIATTDAQLTGSGIIIPQKLNGAFIEINLNSGGILTYSLPTTTVFEGKKQYSYEIKVNLTGLVVTSEITPWEAIGVPVEGNATMD